MSTARPLAFFRNRLIHLLSVLPVTRTYLVEMRMKPQTKYKAGFFLFNGPKKRMVGSLLPQPEVITQEGQRVLLDEVLGAGFALLRRHSNPEEAFASIQTDFWERLGARFVCIQTGEVPLVGHPANARRATCAQAGCKERPVIVRSIDKDFPGVSQNHFILVRPDRLIMGIFKEHQVDAFVSALQRLL